jgi:hypothetical protein
MEIFLVVLALGVVVLGAVFTATYFLDETVDQTNG